MNGRRSFDVDTASIPIHLGDHTNRMMPGEDARVHADIYRRA